MDDQLAAEADDVSMLGEILSLPPRLASRTIAQVQASQHLLSMLWCATSERGGIDPAANESGSSAGAMAEPVDVLSVIDDGSEVGTPKAATDDATATVPGDAFESDVPAPAVEDLPIPGYDSLAASQVVPRLASMSESELAAIGAYEAANRARRTILNRVTQLQGK